MINLDFDVNKIFQERLASSIGLDKYQLIMSEVHKTDVSKDLQSENFQRVLHCKKKCSLAKNLLRLF